MVNNIEQWYGRCWGNANEQIVVLNGRLGCFEGYVEIVIGKCSL
jgi:hypothetical protein